MYKWLILMAACFSFSIVSAQEGGTTPPSEEITADDGQGGEVSLPPSLSDCPCKGKGNK